MSGQPWRNASDGASQPCDENTRQLGVGVAGRPLLPVFGTDERLLEPVESEPVVEERLQDHPERPVEVPLLDGLAGDGDALSNG